MPLLQKDFLEPKKKEPLVWKKLFLKKAPRVRILPKDHYEIDKLSIK